MVQPEKTKLSPSLDFMALGTIPVSPKERHEMAQALENRIDALWRAELSPEERKALDSGGELTDASNRTLDEIIIRLGHTWGWRLYVCHSVQRRLTYWHQKAPDYLELLSRFNKAMLAHAKLQHNVGKLPLDDPYLPMAKQVGAEELRHLIRQCGDTFRERPRTPSAEELCEWFTETVERNAAAFPYWRQNLQAFLRYQEEVEPGLLEGMASGTISAREAPSIFDRIFAYGCNVDPETARKRISKITSSKKVR